MASNSERDASFEGLKKMVSDHIDLISFGKNAYKEATERTTKFLVVVSILADHRLDLERHKAKVSTLRDAFYSKAMTEAEGKTITEKKLKADQEVNYTNQREAVEEIEAEISWIKTHIDIFNNAHVTYRQIAKGE